MGATSFFVNLHHLTTIMANYDTNLAAEYYVMSCLHRLGMTASLTLGNKKGVDILVARDNGDAVTVEVKGVAKCYDWTLGKTNREDLKTRGLHFFVLVTFNGKIADNEMPSPDVWVIPSSKLDPFIREYENRTNVSRAEIVRAGREYKHAWSTISHG